MANDRNVLTLEEREARRKNARHSTGPRTEAGKRRVALNALKHGLYSRAHALWETMVALDEDPHEFESLLRNLMAARRPADAVEMMLVEDLAVLQWKKARLDRAQAGVQVRNLQKHDLERHRRVREVGREGFSGSQAEVLAKGLRGVKDAPGKFEETLFYLEALLEQEQKNQITEKWEDVLRGLYGDQPTFRGAGIVNLFRDLQKLGENDPRRDSLRGGLELALREEIRDVAEEYELFLEEHVQSSRAARSACLAPTQPQWTLMIRQENALNRLIERKLRLLEQIQEKRQARERATLLAYVGPEAMSQRTRSTRTQTRKSP